MVRRRVNNYCYCRVHPEGLLCDAERDLLAIAKFLFRFVTLAGKVRFVPE